MGCRQNARLLTLARAISILFLLVFLMEMVLTVKSEWHL